MITSINRRRLGFGIGLVLVPTDERQLLKLVFLGDFFFLLCIVTLRGV